MSEWEMRHAKPRPDWPIAVPEEPKDEPKDEPAVDPHIPGHARRVYQYDLDGKFIAEHESIKSAARAVKGHDYLISRAARLVQRFSAGSCWRYYKVDSIIP